MSKSYRICGQTPGGVCPIEITEGEFKGVKYAYGKVAVEELDDSANISFEYDIFEGNVSAGLLEDFKKLTGDILVDILNDQLDNNEVIYTGGIDAT